MSDSTKHKLKEKQVVDSIARHLDGQETQTFVGEPPPPDEPEEPDDDGGGDEYGEMLEAFRQELVLKGYGVMLESRLRMNQPLKESTLAEDAVGHADAVMREMYGRHPEEEGEPAVHLLKKPTWAWCGDPHMPEDSEFFTEDPEKVTCLECLRDALEEARAPVKGPGTFSVSPHVVAPEVACNRCGKPAWEHTVQSGFCPEN